MKAIYNTNETNEAVEVTEKKAKKRRSPREWGHDTLEKLKTREGRIEILKDCGKVALGVGIGVGGAIVAIIKITSGYETDPGPDDDRTNIPDESNPIVDVTNNEEPVEVDNGNSESSEESSDGDASDEETI